mmetsp:Transcript_28446/g.44456  ORF Transcript_28446/g.44456 Transcript_28446/m.44456 type:complete len:117 (-) Transcript_28446:18-368(-)
MHPPQPTRAQLAMSRAVTAPTTQVPQNHNSAGQMDCLYETTATMWLSMLRMFNKQVCREDITVSAQQRLAAMLKELASKEALKQSELQSMATEAKKLARGNPQKLKHVLLRSRVAR